MKRDEWYDSARFKKLRFLNNMSFEIHHKCQNLQDVLEIVIEDAPDLAFIDKFTLVQDQLRIVYLESQRLMDRIVSLIKIIEPIGFDDEQSNI
jgi:hypothetical protein